MKKIPIVWVICLIAVCGFYVFLHEKSPTDSFVEVSLLNEEGTLLDLSNKGLKQIPTDTFSKTNVVRLDVSNNEISGSIQAEIRNLYRLKELNASHNRMTGLPAEIGQLSELEVLDVSYNDLTGLPHELANLKNLKQLDLRGNNPSEYDLEIIRSALPDAQILVD